jgi:hypothetical protein
LTAVIFKKTAQRDSPILLVAVATSLNPALPPPTPAAAPPLLLAAPFASRCSFDAARAHARAIAAAAAAAAARPTPLLPWSSSMDMDDRGSSASS